MANTKKKNTKTSRAKKADPALVEFGKRVIEARGDLSQGDFGNAIGMSQGLISTVERGQPVPSKWYGLIAQHYNIAPPAMAQATAVTSPANTRRAAKRATRSRTQAKTKAAAGQRATTPARMMTPRGSRLVEASRLGAVIDACRKFQHFDAFAGTVTRARDAGFTIDELTQLLGVDSPVAAAGSNLTQEPNGRAHARTVTPRQVAQA